MNPAGFSRRRIQFNPGIAAWSLDNLIRSYQHIRRNRQADLLDGFKIDHQVELRRLLDREFRGLAPFKILSTYVAVRRNKSVKLAL